MTLQRRWWALACRGLAALLACLALLGVAVGWSALDDTGLQRLAAAWLGAHGLCALAAVQPDVGRWPALALDGVLALLVAVFVGARAPLLPATFAYTLAAWGIASGMLEVAASARLRAALGGEVALAGAGFAAVLFGVVVGSWARAGLPDALLALCALTFVVAATHLKLAVRLHHAGGAPTELPHG